MAEKIISEEKILENLSKDVNFGIQFIVSNQPNIVIDRLKENGYDKAHTTESAYNLLIDLYKVDPAKVGEILNNIPYDNSTENYTGGLGQHFFESQPLQKSMSGSAQTLTNPGDTSGTSSGSSGSSGSINWGGILSGVGALLGGVATGFFGGGTTTTQQQQQLMLQQQQQQQLERERRQRNAMLWGVVAVVVLIVVVIMYKQSKKK